MNQVFIIGNCGKDPVYKEIGEKNTPIAEFSVATSKPPFKKGDKWPTEWHLIKVWRKAAEKVRDKLRKGDLVALAGELKTEQWTNTAGEKHQRTIVEVSFPQNVVIEMKDDGQAQPEDNGNAW